MGLGRSLLVGAGSAALLGASATGASAGAFGLRSQSTVGIGQAFAGTASGAAGVSSAFWNPATITMNPGYNSEYNATLVDASARIRVLAPTPTAGFGSSGELAQLAPVPATYSTYQINDTVWLGLASAAPFGSITKPNTVWAGQTYSRSSRIQSLNFAPLLGVKINEWLSVGIGPTVQYFKVRLNQASGIAPTAGNIILEGDSLAAGVTAGATITPMPGTVFGIGWRSGIQHEVEGTFRTPLAVLPVRVNVNLPDQVTFGVTQAITGNFRLSAGFEWMNWSKLGTPSIRLATLGNPVAPFPLNYKDGYLYSFGGEYQIDPQWAVRAGIAYEVSPIDVSNRSTRLPDTDRIYGSVGASYAWSEKITFNASYSHIFAVGNKQLRLTAGNPLFNGLPFFGVTEADVNLFSLSARVRWDDPKVAEAAPIIRKF
ncbi:MAG: rane protein involved in aromatic hydrocarbon degradation [Enterovirga sp.]|nr:rane protein involved in aromatic hydrocarbon degradation [Enterovirga sp.]